MEMIDSSLVFEFYFGVCYAAATLQLEAGQPCGRTFRVINEEDENLMIYNYLWCRLLRFRIFRHHKCNARTSHNTTAIANNRSIHARKKSSAGVEIKLSFIMESIESDCRMRLRLLRNVHAREYDILHQVQHNNSNNSIISFISSYIVCVKCTKDYTQMTISCSIGSTSNQIESQNYPNFEFHSLAFAKREIECRKYE